MPNMIEKAMNMTRNHILSQYKNAIKNGNPVCPEKNESFPKKNEEYSLVPMMPSKKFCELGSMMM